MMRRAYASRLRVVASDVSGVARILLKGVLKVNGQLAGHRGWGRKGYVPPPAEGGSF